MLPSTGFAPEDYTFLLWSRTQLAPGVQPQLGIADFAPDEGLLPLVPEPSTWAMMLLGFGAVGFTGATVAQASERPQCGARSRVHLPSKSHSASSGRIRVRAARAVSRRNGRLAQLI